MGSRIDPDKCIACGECCEVCTFRAIVGGEPYIVTSERCDECGSCIMACPSEAIECSKTMLFCYSERSMYSRSCHLGLLGFMLKAH